MKYHHPLTPAEISREISELCNEIAGEESSPIYVDCKPLQNAPSRECFPIVEEQVSREGGAIVFGWSIWELPTVFIEAEFHAVWQSPDGRLIDIAPKDEPTAKILFQKDSLRVYEDRQINNLRRPLRQHPSVIEFIALCNREYEFMNRGERAGLHGEIQLQEADAIEYTQLQMQKAELHLSMLSMVPDIGPYGPCPCGSGKKKKWCHKSA